MRRSTSCLLLLALGTISSGCKDDGGSGDEFGFDPDGTAGPTGGTATAGDTTGGGEGTADGTGTGEPTGGSDDTGPPPDEGAHALGTIVIGESHSVGGADATAFLTATFVPNADEVPASCATEIGGCTVDAPPVCEVPCLVGEVCEFNDACVPECTTPCNLACAADEVCYFPVPDIPACRKLETFDAGRLDFVGTKVPITLFPPYVLPAGVEGTLTLPDATVTVTSTGATEAGFAPFEAMVTVSDSVFSTIDQIPLADAFGPGDMPVGWAPGADDITVSVQVLGNLGGVGTVTCPGDDTTGQLMVPRPALAAAIDEMDTIASMTISVTRTRSEVTMGHETVGALIGVDLPEQGWIDFSFASVETGSIMGCTVGLTPCGAMCVNTASDPMNCGMCGNACAVGQTCSASTCI